MDDLKKPTALPLVLALRATNDPLRHQAADRIEELETVLRSIKGVGPLTREMIIATLSSNLSEEVAP